MKMKRILILVLIIATFVLVAISNSEAVCGQYGKIVYSYTTGATTYVFIAQNTPLPTYYYYFTTTDPEIMAKVNSAQAGNLKCYIYGNNTACPTAGTSRYGGVITTIYTYSLY